MTEYPSVSNNINIVGVSEFLNDEDDDDILEIEKNIVNYENGESYENVQDKIDYEKEFRQKWSLISKKLDIGDPDEEDEEDEGDEPERGFVRPHANSGTSWSSRPSNIGSARQAEESYVVHSDRELQHFSEEQRKQHILQRAIASRGSLPATKGQSINLDFEKSEDRKNILLEEINMLRTNLVDEGANIDDVMNVSSDNTFNEVDSVYKQLRYRNDHRRYCAFANELAQMGAAGLEWAFDGKKKYIGGFKPDLTGWGATLNIKMRRLNYEMSSVVSSGMRNHNVNSMGRIFLELIPSLFLHTKMRKNRFNGGNRVTNQDDLDAAINICRDMEENR